MGHRISPRASHSCVDVCNSLQMYDTGQTMRQRNPEYDKPDNYLKKQLDFFT